MNPQVMRWRVEAVLAAIRIAKRRGIVDADDVRAVVGPPPKGVDPRIMSAVFADRNLWERVGTRPGTRRESHKRPVTVWGLIGRRGTVAQARRVLASLDLLIAKMKKRRLK
jgi:hypothetical protein